jgi:predicted dehydrogenase
MGGKFADYDNREVPDTLEVLWTYPGQTLVSFSQYNASSAPASTRSCEIEFRGTKGTLYLNTNGYEVVPEIILPNEFAARTPVDRSIERKYRTGGKSMIEPRKVSSNMLDADHARNFLDCVRTRHVCNCDLETGHRATTATLIGNIAHQTRSYLLWDAAAERFTNNSEANNLLSYEYRKPYALPT